MTMTTKINSIMEAGKIKAGEFKAWGSSNAPTILTITGCLLTLGATIYACVQTQNLSEINKERNERLDILDQDYKEGEMSKKEYNSSVRETYISWALRVGKNFAIPVALEVLGIGCVCKGHGMMIGRVASLGTLLNEALQREQSLEDRIREEYGEEVLKKLKYGKPYVLTTMDSDGTITQELIYNDDHDWDFTWKPGMRNFNEEDHQENLNTIRALRNTGHYAQMYNSMFPVNRAYEILGNVDAITAENDYASMGWPNYRVARKLIDTKSDYPYKFDVEIEVTSHYTGDSKAPDIKIHFPRKPISCLEMNAEAGFRSKRDLDRFRKRHSK